MNDIIYMCWLVRIIQNTASVEMEFLEDKINPICTLKFSKFPTGSPC